MWQPPGLSTVKSKKTKGFGVDSKCMCCSGEARFDFAQAGNAAGGAKVTVALDVSRNRIRRFSKSHDKLLSITGNEVKGTSEK